MKSSLEALDWGRACAAIAAHAQSALGQRFVRGLAPLRSREALAEACAAVAEAGALLDEGTPPAFAGIDDLAPLLEAARTRASGLDGKELAALLRTVRNGEHARQRLVARRDAPRLRARAAALPDLSELVARLAATVDAAGAVLDDASPELAAARRTLGPAERRVRELALDVAARGEWRPLLRDGPPVLRDGRYLLAVKADARGRIPGILHDRSLSGESVFVEPEELVEPQNRLADLRAQERRAVARVLLERTRELVRADAAISESQRLLAALDALFARARFGQAIGGRVVPAGGDGPLRLRRARHPLLLLDALASGGDPARRVVPFDLELGARFDALVISGPNTGGKTATLKAIGLLASLALAAVPLPVDEGSEVPWFDEVHADVGDEQDLAQNLSTFSGHLRRIADVLARATPRSLVLLDELGTGTEPKEGEALGRALLLALVERGCRVVATTHLSGLKDLGFTAPRVENASLEFDGETLAPLFRLTLGLPGESNALKIARRHGIPAPIVERAEAFLTGGRGSETGRAQELASRTRQAALQRLEAAEAELARAEEARVAATAREAELVAKAKLLEAEKDREVERALREAQARGRELLEAFASVPAGLAGAVSRLRAFVESLPERSSLSERRASYLASLKKGAAVYLPRYREHCVVRKVDAEKRTVTVLYRRMPIELAFDEVALPDER